ncbi:MAG TPA: hypothetical protein VHU86_02435 [Solirubrobacterales bacterium]|nr:hypothetical protein [Solirubrobacterales bacterium]
MVEFGKFGTEAGEAGGQINAGYAQGLAVNRGGAGGVGAGDVYVSDRKNNRVQEFTKVGTFVRSWGKDVIKSGAPHDTGTGFEVCETAGECKAGVSAAEAGAFNVPTGIAIDQETGNVYVSDSSNSRIDIYSAQGAFEGAFGWDVKVTGAAEELQFCTTATGCQSGKSTAGAGGFAEPEALAVDPADGHLLVGDSTNHRVNEFAFTLNGSEEVTGVEFVRALGWKVNSTMPAEELQQCTTASGCLAGTVGAGAGQFGTVRGLAVDASGAIYAVDESYECIATTPCRVEKLDPAGTLAETFGPSTGGETGCQVNWSAGGFGNGNPQGANFAQAAYGIAVDPADQHVFVTRKLGSTQGGFVKALDICEFDSEGTVVQRSPAAPLATSIEGTQSLAVGSEERVYLEASNEAFTAWPVTVFGYVPAAPVRVAAPTSLTSTSAILNGEVTVPKPGGHDTDYRFEYSPDNGLTWLRAPSSADASLGSTTPGTYVVHQKVTNLLPNTTYRVRLVSTTSYVTTSEEKTFTTPLEAPRIGEIRARDASQSAIFLEAKINPAGSPTNYRFEWGSTSSYGHEVPAEYEPFAGSGHEGTVVTAKLTGLPAGTVYHYRVVATNQAGTATSPDQEAETLDSCGLFEARCFEMVSPREPFPAEQPGSFNSPGVLHFQAADQPGSLAYIDEAGEEDATQGGEILYQGIRGAGEAGWSSTQLSPPITAPDLQSGTTAFPSAFYGFSRDLRCAAVGATQPLTEDPAAEAVREAGGGNLYRRNPDGSYDLITAVPPEELNRTGSSALAFEFELIGMSRDCAKVVFSTSHHYFGAPGAGTERLYEWEEGSGLRTVGWAPKEGGGEEAVTATGGNSVASSAGDRLGAVSEDGSRVFFSATRLTGAVPGEKGKTGVFVREDGTSSTDISASETAVADEGAEYQGATPDGRRVYFTANAGLTTESSEAGTTDLYEYDFAKGAGERLTDISATEVAGGARVGGLVPSSSSFGALAAVAPDGSHVYFIARGQLLPGSGPTLAENEASNTFSLYDYDTADEAVRFVATINELNYVTVGKQFTHTSRVSPDGRYLLFQSSTNVTGYDSGGVAEVYLYDAKAPAGTEATICLSCRTDGKPSVSHSSSRLSYYPVAFGGEGNRLFEPHSLVIRGGRPEAFFLSQDKLAEGAIEGQENLYAWAHGQVFLVAAEPPTSLEVRFVGASDEGEDLYLYSAAALNWENPEARPQVWDARVGGGFAGPPPPPAAPCDAGTEGACRTAAAPPPAVPSGGASTFNGPGNVKSKKKHPKRHTKYHPKKKHVHKGEKRHHPKKKQRQANRNRRAGK